MYGELITEKDLVDHITMRYLEVSDSLNMKKSVIGGKKASCGLMKSLTIAKLLCMLVNTFLKNITWWAFIAEKKSKGNMLLVTIVCQHPSQSITVWEFQVNKTSSKLTSNTIYTWKINEFIKTIGYSNIFDCDKKLNGWFKSIFGIK